MIAEVLHKIAGMQKPDTGWKYYPRPSLAGPERCLRQLCYMARGEKGKPIADRLIMVLDDSSWHEELTADWLRKSQFKLHSQQMTVECAVVLFGGRPFVVKGHIDGILTTPQGVDYLWEHKAINHFAFQRYQKEDFPLDYLSQCSFYMQGLNRIQPDLEEGILLMKNKNTSQYLEFLFHYNAEKDLMTVKEVISSDGSRRDGNVFFNLYGNAMRRFEEVERHTAEGSLPERQYELEDWQCSYCTYNDSCWENYEEEFKKLNQTVELSPETILIAQQYQDISNQIKKLEKMRDESRDLLKKTLKSLGVTRGTANDLWVTLTLQKRFSINKEAIPEEILKTATKETLTEVLTVREIKRKEE